MSSRRDLERHRQSLQDIRQILHALKSLAFLETRKLQKLLASQRDVVAHLENSGREMLRDHPELRETTAALPVHILILLGTVRGFCGDLNDKVFAQAQTLTQQLPQGSDYRLITVGERLGMRHQKDPRVVAQLSGASVAEEVEPLLGQLVEELQRQLHQQPQARVSVVYMAGEQGDLQQRSLIPPFQADDATSVPASGYPALLQVSPAEFLRDLLRLYLFSGLQELLYEALMAENHRRVQHLDGAVRHLDQNLERLQQRANALRQEEIIEGIEVILLHAVGDESG